MSETYTVTINGLEARVQVGNGYATSEAATIVFDEDANIVEETYFTRYSGFCVAEIVYRELGKTLATRRGIEYEDLWDSLGTLDLVCHCEDED